jgi:NADH-quinone oxidoreductase subunit G
VVSFSPFDSNVEQADVILPITPFSETGGSFVNAESNVQTFHGVVKPLGDARPGWKVLRVLGNLLGLPGFAQETVEEVRAEAFGDLDQLAQRLSNASTVAHHGVGASAGGIERVSNVPIYATDLLVRRAPSLQLTADARALPVSLPAGLWNDLGLGGLSSVQVRVSQGSASAVLTADCDTSLADNTVRVAAGLPSTAALGAAFGPLQVARA